MAFVPLAPPPALPVLSPRPAPDVAASLVASEGEPPAAGTDDPRPGAAHASAHLASVRAQPGTRAFTSILATGLDRATLAAVWDELPPERWSVDPVSLALLVSRLGERALPKLVAFESHLGIEQALFRVRASWVALPMARAMTVRARRWLVQHRDVAAPALAHAALFGRDVDRLPAERALVWLARCDRDGVREATRTLGDDVAEAVDAMLAPERAAGPPFARPLPKLVGSLALLDRGGRSLSGAERDEVVRRLASALPADHPALAEILEECDRASLAELGRALFDAWVEGRMATQNQWIADACLVTGGDAATRDLGRRARRWAGARDGHERRAARAVIHALGRVASRRPGAVVARAPHGVRASSASGARDATASSREAWATEAALAELATLAAAGHASVREAALDELARIGLERGIEVDDLATPQIDTELALDYGPRRFVARLDGDLALRLFDADGKPMDALPRATKKDDAAKAKAAKAAYGEAREAVQSAVRAEAARLERAMVTERRWPASRFLAHVASGPIASRVAQRIVFGALAAGAPATTFRVAEDGSLASVDDELFVLGPDAHVGVVHPLVLDPGLRERWVALFQSYELLPPFEQLGRTVHRSLDELEAASLHPGTVWGLRDRGWRLIQDDWPEVGGAERPLARGVMRVGFEPGFSPEEMASAERQRVRTPTLAGDATPIELSEIVRDLRG